MKIAFIGVSNVGAPLADRLQQLGHSITIAARDPQSQTVQAALQRNSALLVQSPAAAVEAADVVFLMTPFAAIASAIALLVSALSGKIVVDYTSPIGANLTHGLQSQTSGGETVQQLVPDGHVVKAFTIYGHENFEDSDYPDYADLKSAMLIAGTDATAKTVVAELYQQLGYESVDTGDISLNLPLKHMTLLGTEVLGFSIYLCLELGKVCLCDESCTNPLQ